MRYVAAYLLAVAGGKEAPTAKDLKAILESVGVGYDDERAKNVVTKLAGKTISEVKGIMHYTQILLVTLRGVMII